MKNKPSLLFFILIIATASLTAETVVYKVDPVHSGVAFKIRHFLNKIPGAFAKFEGEIHFDPENPENSKAVGSVVVNSVDTRNEKRDKHLQSEDYFKASENPVIEFSSSKWTPDGDNSFIVTGVLKMAGIEQVIEVQLAYLGEMEARGKIRSGWEGSAKIDRTLWDINSGAPAVGNEVEIELNIQAHRQ